MIGGREKSNGAEYEGNTYLLLVSLNRGGGR